MSTDNMNTALATDTATPEVIRPKISDYRRHLLICTGPRCAPDGAAQDLFDSLGAKFKAAGLNDGELRVKRSRVGCFAACKGGPVMCVQPDGTWYYNVTPANMDTSSPNTWWAGCQCRSWCFTRGPPGGDGLLLFV